jgi:hypothetical protein
LSSIKNHPKVVCYGFFGGEMTIAGVFTSGGIGLGLG